MLHNPHPPLSQWVLLTQQPRTRTEILETSATVNGAIQMLDHLSKPCTYSMACAQMPVMLLSGPYTSTGRPSSAPMVFMAARPCSTTITSSTTSSSGSSRSISHHVRTTFQAWVVGLVLVESPAALAIFYQRLSHPSKESLPELAGNTLGTLTFTSQLYWDTSQQLGHAILFPPTRATGSLGYWVPLQLP